jgi:hypothetical protein
MMKKKKISLAKRYASPARKREIQARRLKRKEALAKAKRGIAKIRKLDSINQYRLMNLLLKAHYFGKKPSEEAKKQIRSLGDNTIWMAKGIRPVLEEKMGEVVFKRTGLSMEKVQALSRPKTVSQEIEKFAKEKGMPFNQARMVLTANLNMAKQQADFISSEKNKLMYHKTKPGTKADLVVRNASDAFGNIMTSIKGYIDLAVKTLGNVEMRF